jgi:hypothetical protein
MRETFKDSNAEFGNVSANTISKKKVIKNCKYLWRVFAQIPTACMKDS